MMLDYLGQSDAAALIEAGIIDTIGKMKSLNAGQMGMGTSDVGDLVAAFVAKD
jgi:3-isopropylmalate dehydrogenase